MASITQTLCSKLKTVSNRESFLYLIDGVLESNLQDRQVAVERLDAYITSIGIDALDTSDSALQKTKADLLSVVVVKVALPYIPKSGFLGRLYSIVSSAETSTLLEISIDEGLKGGFVVYKEGKVVDMSFKTRVEKLFKQDTFRAKVLQILQ